MRKILLVLLAASVALVVWDHSQKVSENAGTESPYVSGEAGGTLEHKVKSFTIDGRSPNGVKQWHLEGDSAEIIGEDIHLNHLTAVTYGDDSTVYLVSDSGIYRKDVGEVELIGNVKVTADGGFMLTTQHARWSQNTKEISTDVLVNIVHEGLAASGMGGMANSDDKIAILKKDVTVTVQPDTKVDCDGPMEVRYGDNVATFRDNVRVEDKDGRLVSDKLTVEFDPETKKLARVIAEGNVRLKRGKSYTISDKAIYTDSTKTAQLLGNPRVVIAPEELTDAGGFEGIMGSKNTDE